MRAATMTIETLRSSRSLVITRTDAAAALGRRPAGPSRPASRTAPSPRSSSAAACSSRARSSSSSSTRATDPDTREPSTGVSGARTRSGMVRSARCATERMSERYPRQVRMDRPSSGDAGRTDPRPDLALHHAWRASAREVRPATCAKPYGADPTASVPPRHRDPRSGLRARRTQRRHRRAGWPCSPWPCEAGCSS